MLHINCAKNTVHIGSTEYIKYIHIGAYSYHDYRQALQAVFSVIYMSVIVASQHESIKQLNSE